jgi:hypothetical protein
MLLCDLRDFESYNLSEKVVVSNYRVELCKPLMNLILRLEMNAQPSPIINFHQPTLCKILAYLHAFLERMVFFAPFPNESVCQSHAWYLLLQGVQSIIFLCTHRTGNNKDLNDLNCGWCWYWCEGKTSKKLYQKATLRAGCMQNPFVFRKFGCLLHDLRAAGLS